MATLGIEALTMSDLRKRSNFDGSVDFIIEALENSNPVLQDMVWKEGNLPTGNKTTIRTALPTPQVRLINRGITPSKSLTKQVTDTCMMLEDRSTIDVKLLRLYGGNAEAYRRSEDAAFVQGFSDVIAANLFYGDTDANPGTFNGLSVRYSVCGGEKNDAGYQVVSGGTPGTDTNTSAFLVGFGTHATTGIYPRGSQAGLHKEDLGENDAEDANGGKYRAVSTLFSFDCGLAVQDIRANALVRNIDVTKLAGMTSAQKLALIEKFVIAKNRIRNLQRGDKKLVWYVSSTMYDFFELYLLDKNNVHVTRQDLLGQSPVLYFAGIPVKMCDAISEKEAAFTVV